MKEIKLNKMNDQLPQQAKREIHFKPNLSIYATNNGLSDRNHIKYANSIQAKNNSLQMPPFFHMRLKSESRQNVLTNESTLQGNSTMDDLKKYKKNILLNDSARYAPRDKLASVSIHYRRHKGRQMSTICAQKGVSDLAFSNLVDHPMPQQDLIMKNKPLKK